MKNKNECGTFAPKYYSSFKCIADKCRHSCCVDWRIYIDCETFHKYSNIESIFDTVQVGDFGPFFELCEDGRCPHLNDNGLCNIITDYGEDHLCEICRNHPRFYNYINGGRTEAGLGIVCEEACRLILEDSSPFELYKIEDAECIDEESDFDPLLIRDEIIADIENPGMSFDEKLSCLKNKFKIPSVKAPDEWRQFFLSLEILDTEWEKVLNKMEGKLLFVNTDNSPELDKYYQRLLKYFVYRHVSAAENIVDVIARLSFAILSVEVIRSVFEELSDKTLEGLIEISRLYSSEIEYSEENTEEIIFLFESEII